MSTEPTPEQMLSAIIEAQVKGGYDKWKWLINWVPKGGIAGTAIVYGCEAAGEIEHVLAILLDPAGLRAIWPKMAREAGEGIYRAWYDVGAAGAIDTAFRLLPR